MPDRTYKQTKHEQTRVAVIPPCDLHPDRDVLAYADARMTKGLHAGQWAYVCREHFNTLGCQLGLGKGQELLLDGGS